MSRRPTAWCSSTDEMLVVHAHDFLDTSLRFPFAPPQGMDDRSYALNFPAR